MMLYLYIHYRTEGNNFSLDLIIKHQKQQLVRNCQTDSSTEKHRWMQEIYLNALASGDVWIIIQPFFRRLEPQAAAVSRRRWSNGRRSRRMRRSNRRTVIMR